MLSQSRLTANLEGRFAVLIGFADSGVELAVLRHGNAQSGHCISSNFVTHFRVETIELNQMEPVRGEVLKCAIEPSDLDRSDRVNRVCSLHDVTLCFRYLATATGTMPALCGKVGEH